MSSAGIILSAVLHLNSGMTADRGNDTLKLSSFTTRVHNYCLRDAWNQHQSGKKSSHTVWRHQAAKHWKTSSKFSSTDCRQKQMKMLILLVLCFTLIECINSAPAEHPIGSSSIPIASPETKPSPSPASSARQIQPRPREQSYFNSEEGIEKPVSIPRDVLEVLRGNKRNQTCLQTKQSPNDMPASWFIAAEI